MTEPRRYTVKVGTPTANSPNIPPKPTQTSMRGYPSRGQPSRGQQSQNLSPQQRAQRAAAVQQRGIPIQPQHRGQIRRGTPPNQPRGAGSPKRGYPPMRSRPPVPGQSVVARSPSPSKTITINNPKPHSPVMVKRKLPTNRNDNTQTTANSPPNKPHSISPPKPGVPIKRKSLKKPSVLPPPTPIQEKPEIIKPAIPSKPIIPAKPLNLQVTRADTLPVIPIKPPLPEKPESLIITKEPIELHWPTDKSPFEKPDDPSLIVYEQKEEEDAKIKAINEDAKIKAATIEKLIEKSTSCTAGKQITLPNP